jgi:NADH:ubiquinone oxidoreductase subunit 2 (subunit N)
MKTGNRILYPLLLIFSSLLAGWSLLVNLQELIGRSSGKDTLFSLMYNLNDKEAILYSIAYLLPLIVLLVAGIRFAVKRKRKQAVICYSLIILVFALQLYTDSLFFRPAP